MNITGYGQYSKQIAGIRDPAKHTGNQQHKLIFIYPMLFADKIKVQNMQSFENLIRDFISVTFLSDIFVQNTFNMIGLANQIRPLWDEHRQEVNPTAGIIKALGGSQQGVYTSGPSTPNYPIAPDYKPELQNKITQKTAVIQHLLKTDPKFAKTRPFIEIITLGNMIEVPVIVGTAQFPVDTLTLMYVLIAAIGLNKKLTSEADLDFIFHELESMNEKKYWALLTNLTKSPKDRSAVTWLEQHAFSGLKKVAGWGSTLPTIAAAAKNQAARLQKHLDNPPELEHQNRLFAPLLLRKEDLDQTKLYFKFVLNSDFAKKRFGIDTSDEASKRSEISQAKLQGDLSKIRDVTMSNFAEIIGHFGSVLLRSISNLISTQDSTVNYDAEKTRNIDIGIMEKVNPIVEEILIAIDNGLKGSSIDESRNKIKILKDLCNIPSSDHLEAFISNIRSANILSDDFDEGNFRTFVSYFDQTADASKAASLKIENEIGFIASSSERAALEIRFNELEQVINTSISSFFDPFKTDLNNGNASRLATINKTDNQRIISQTIPKFTTGLTNIFCFVLFANIQSSLCKFILTADVDLEMTKNEVTAWPNYTLTLPVEIVLALHAAFMGMSWEHLLQGGQIGQDLKTNSSKKDPLTGTVITTEKARPMTNEQAARSTLSDVSDSYIRPAIKYICKRLDVPNIIVVDTKKGDIYYKLMNQTDVNKTKISTIETFIQSKLNRPLMTTQF